MRGITASGDTIPDALFEVADLRVENRPVFIDCKNYGTQTLRQFALPPDDPLHVRKLIFAYPTASSDIIYML